MTSSADVRGAYEGWHARLGVDPEASAPWHVMVRERLDAERDLRGKRSLEVACGRGDFACWLARQPVRPAIVALDLSLTAVRMARAHADEHGIEGIRWGVADITRLPHEPDAFDTVFCFETIEHAVDPVAAVHELARVLRRGGRLFLTTPNYLNVWGLYRVFLRLAGRRFSEAGQPINHPLLLTTTRNWVRRAGLRVTLLTSTCHLLPTWPGRPAREIRFLARVPLWRTWMGQQSLIVAEKP